MIINILSVTYYTFTGIVFIFILLGIIGKFGLFPLNLGSTGGLLDNGFYWMGCLRVEINWESMGILVLEHVYS